MQGQICFSKLFVGSHTLEWSPGLNREPEVGFCVETEVPVCGDSAPAAGVGPQGDLWWGQEPPRDTVIQTCQHLQRATPAPSR